MNAEEAYRALAPDLGIDASKYTIFRAEANGNCIRLIPGAVLPRSRMTEEDAIRAIVRDEVAKCLLGA